MNNDVFEHVAMSSLSALGGALLGYQLPRALLFDTLAALTITLLAVMSVVDTVVDVHPLASLAGACAGYASFRLWSRLAHAHIEDALVTGAALHALFDGIVAGLAYLATGRSVARLAFIVHVACESAALCVLYAKGQSARRCIVTCTAVGLCQSIGFAACLVVGGARIHQSAALAASVLILCSILAHVGVAAGFGAAEHKHG
jgi:hypothetical protein